MHGTLSEYIPPSWFHPRGIHKVLKRLEPRLPNVNGCLFLTLTFDPSLFSGPESAFEKGNDRIRRMFHDLRKGVTWEDKEIQIGAPYFRKLEFHKNGWAHFHIIVRTRRFLPAALLAKLWSYGRCNVQRISNEDFRYLLKYVTKGIDDLPEWVKQRPRLRIVQASRGFYKKVSDAKPAKKKSEPGRTITRPASTIGERMESWRRTALFRSITDRYSIMRLQQPFPETFDHLLWSFARAGKYLGNGYIKITNGKDLSQWTNPKTEKK